MGNFTIKVEGLKELQDNLKKFGADMATKAFNQSLAAGAKIVKQAAIAKAPIAEKAYFRYDYNSKLNKKLGMKAPKRLVQPGTLKRSIYAFKVKDNISPTKFQYNVGAREGFKARKLKSGNADAYYAHIIEHGSKYFKGQKFMTKAFEENKSLAQQKIIQTARLLAEKYGNRK